MRNLILILLVICSSISHAGVLLQGFYWDAPSDDKFSWWDRLATHSNDIAKAGFTAVWIPPVLKGASGGYSNGYDPYDDYDIGSKDQRSTYRTHWGTREQLQRAVAMMRANGLEVYVDLVLGHRNGDGGDSHFSYVGARGIQNIGRFEKPPAFFSGFNDFGRQLNYQHGSLREQLIEAGDWLIGTLGVQGMRIDAAKNVSPDFLRDYLSKGAMADKLTIAEFWSENIGELEHYVRSSMQERVAAFDFPLWGLLKDMSNGKGYFDMRKLESAGLVGRMPTRSVTFVENHDTDRSYPTHTNKHLGYAYILTSEGYPSVFWKDYIEYKMKPVIDPLIWIHEKIASGKTEWRWASEDLVVYERRGGPGLLVGINDNQMQSQKQWVQTGFGGNVALHDYTGNGHDIRTANDGRVEIEVKANSYVAYAPAGLPGQPHTVQSSKIKQRFAGAADLDIPSAVRKEFQTVGRVFAVADSEITWALYPKPGYKGEMQLILADSSERPVIQQKSPLNAKASEGCFRVRQTGFYKFQVKVGADGPDSVDYFLDVGYQAPQKL